MTTRDEIIGTARRWIGTPYVHQASLIHVGCDCLGLVRGVWRETIGEEPEAAPPYTSDWRETPGFETLLDAAHRHFAPLDVADFRAGDVVAFRFRDHLPAKHLGIATSPTHMVHAHSGACVAEIPIGAHWRKRIAGAFAFPGVAD
ncbi:NlpC/P60 family protein [Methylocystis parvus]|uniref:Peptidase P60 n=1 Tax=Methylocystis parvus TaxID=134 RepID=A0A6B8M670_9HYPH|nr:NlpC/P60 family protein [Methylocystis parvus]QGM96330.1 peptidase P60 [Methylocystis parvus]WBJ99831.1 NlpC/P60 family protein [Methylocystis parvus OBBP]